MLPSEFKSKWESMVKESMSSAFIALFEYPILLLEAIQLSSIFIQNWLSKSIKSKLTQISSLFGLSNIELHSNSLLLKLF